MKSGSNSVLRNHAGLESSASPTRGVQKLKQFLGNEATVLAQPKTAKDVVPSLSSSLNSKKRIQQRSGSKEGEEDGAGSHFLSPSVPFQEDACRDEKMNPNHMMGLILEKKVLVHLHSECASGCTRQLSQSQCKAIRFLTSDVVVAPSTTVPPTTKANRVEVAPEGKPILVKRVVLSEEGEGKMFHLVAIAALQRAAQIAAIKEASTTSSSTAAASRDEQSNGRCLYVLTNTNRQAIALSNFLFSHYHLDVVLADSHDAPPFPTLPASFLKGGSYRGGEEHSSSTSKAGGKQKSRPPRSRSPSPPPSSSASPSSPPVEEESNSTSLSRTTTTAISSTASAWSVPVFVGSPVGFLSTDPRSAVWRCVGAFVVLASDSTVPVHPMKNTLLGSETSTLVKLSQHRWACLGHTARSMVLASSEEAVTHPKLDWLISVKPSAEFLQTRKGGKGSAMAPGGGTPDAAEEVLGLGVSSISPHSPPLPRAPVKVRYVALEGLQRMQFLYALIQGLTPGRGMVVRVATREMCVFLFDVLYGLLDQLPPFLRLLSDFQGEPSTSAALPSHADRQHVCEEFDTMVEEGRCASVLFTCFDLVPQRGSIWLQFDVIPNMLNYSSFLAHRITSGAFSTAVPSNGSPQSPLTPTRDGRKKNRQKEEDTLSTPCGITPSSTAVEVVQRTVSRKRSRSPVPLFLQRSEKASPSPARGKDSSCTVSRASPSSSSSPSASQTASDQTAERNSNPTNYSFVFILFRPTEVKPALKHLRATGARFALEYLPLEKPPSLTRFLFVADTIRSMHRTLFQIQNAAYNAYKATMTVYCTLKPRDVYDEEKLDLKKVAGEFGYEELPLLDLRLKDTPFRPKEDYWKASKVKAAKDRRAYKKFADTYIEGEGPAPLEDYNAEKNQ